MKSNNGISLYTGALELESKIKKNLTQMSIGQMRNVNFSINKNKFALIKCNWNRVIMLVWFKKLTFESLWKKCMVCVT